MSERPSEHALRGTTSRTDPPSRPCPAGFRDRRDAGRRLAGRLERYRAEYPDVVALPRGGVPVAAEVARALGAPLDVAVVRKIGAPQNSEYAIGAVAEGGVHVLGHREGRSADLSAAELGELIARAERELEERLHRYRRGRPPVDVRGHTVIVVDDGLATGRSALAGVRSLRGRGARRVILAAPVASRQAAQLLGEAADELVCLQVPADLWAVGAWYEDFRATSDEEVARLLAENAGCAVTGPRPSSR
ncbi:MAG TPA: phosphoribosyltransferase family protein [Solirubrobacteraceae bacterium]|jgi:predicted phosphoribosyltransferase|nr:phosphoribosyltransferase family protein [Solirubrobacteraceae bacterium]